jgi:NAD(P)-dependent dehydrogenase (short-subunit alcohol dehydrogenase family)
VQGFVARQAGQRGVAPELVKAELVRRFPLGEIPADDDVAEVAVLFCSDRMRMVSGQALRIDGGESLL